MKKNKKWYCVKCEYCLQISEYGDVMCEHSAFKTDWKGDLKPYFKNNATVMDTPAYCKNYTKKKKGNKRLVEFVEITIKEQDNE